MSLFAIALNPFNWGSSADDNRWHPPMVADVSKLADFGTKESEFGDQDGDHPRLDRESTLGDEETGFIDTYKFIYNDVEDIVIKN